MGKGLGFLGDKDKLKLLHTSLWNSSRRVDGFGFSRLSSSWNVLGSVEKFRRSIWTSQVPMGVQFIEFERQYTGDERFASEIDDIYRITMIQTVLMAYTGLGEPKESPNHPSYHKYPLTRMLRRQFKTLTPMVVSQARHYPGKTDRSRLLEGSENLHSREPVSQDG
ncbi:hypothetical protein RND71_008411 [Anisodus tanguticus]|uniref:Uncharacterized protein n=1 Tax=Anisodus tanguticus TaxID=243964 RepID=A0AAE1VL04_9SOLA|nr:hypothetical protein RND71_008411 [Anisodus tanguticus]